MVIFDLFFHDIVQEAFVFYENIGTAQEGEWVLADPQFIPYEVDWSVGATAPTDKIDFADIDADGDYDFFVGTYDFEWEVLNGGRLWYSENTGTPEEPEFDMPWYFTDIDVGDESHPTLVDIDGDSDYDLIMRAFSDNGLYIYYFENVGSILEPQWVEVTDDFLGLSDDYGLIYAFGDLDGNETNDLVIGGIWGGLKLYSNGGPLAIEGEQKPFELLPNHIQIMQNYPNPFNRETTFEYTVLRPTAIAIKVYDIQGRVVTSWVRHHPSEGTYKVKWNGLERTGREVPSGIYFISLDVMDEESLGQSQTIKTILLK